MTTGSSTSRRSWALWTLPGRTPIGGPTFHADGHAICILPERLAAAPGFVIRPIEGPPFGAGMGDRDGLGIDNSATRLDVRMTVRTVAAVSPQIGRAHV